MPQASPHGSSAPFQGSALARAVLRLLGWRVHCAAFPARQGVIIVYPHTSNWDLPFMLLAKWSIGVPVRFWGKDSLFRVPLLGTWLRWLGGIPLDRSSPRGAVSDMVTLLQHARQQDMWFWLALSPEGTRKYTDGWRSGFYHVAHQAGVPLMVVLLNASGKRVEVAPFGVLSGDMEADHQRLASHLKGANGFRAKGASPVRPLSSAAPKKQKEVT